MITQYEYQARRNRLAALLPKDAIAIVAAASEQTRNGDAHYRFRQDSNFYYLTGFEEPDALLLVTAGQNSESVLFNRPKNPHEEQWTGKRLGQEDALTALGMTSAYPIERIEDELPQWLSGKTAVFYSLGSHPKLERKIMSALLKLKGQTRRGIKAPSTLCDLEPILGEMRLFKSDAEIDLMQRAADISVAAHKRAMQACKTLRYEYELEGELLYEFSRQGCKSPAYTPIVGSGENACILHYTDNNQPLRC